MSDKYHLPNEQELYLLHQSTESPTTTSSASSPMTTIMQHNNFNWQATSSTSTFDPVVSQYYHNYSHHQPYPFHQQQLWASPHPQQHSQMLLEQQQQVHQQLLHQEQHHLSYRATPSVMQGSIPPYQHYPYHHQQRIDNDFIHQFPSFTGAAGDMNCASQGIVNGLDLYDESTSSIPIDNTANNMIHNALKQKRKEIPTTRIKYEVSSPNSTPLPSPVISSLFTAATNKRKRNILRRASTSLIQEGREGILLEGSLERRRGLVGDNNHHQKTVDQLENELAFLGDECATILIMLDSLRNAFSADIVPMNNSTKASSPSFMTSTINFSNDQKPAIFNNAENSTNQITTSVRRRSITETPEMEREMRIAYDDLMLQVRQLEKKVERLEGKSKSACIVESDTERKEEQDERCSQSSHSTLSEEEEDEDDLRIIKKRRRPVAVANTENTAVSKKKMVSRKGS